MTVPQAEEVVELYVEENWTQKEIAQHFDVADSVISIILRSMRAPGTQESPQNWDEKPWRDEDTLRQLYQDEQLTQAEISERLGVSTQTVRNWMKKHGIETRDTHSGDPNGRYSNPEWLRTEYWDKKKSATQLAQACGVTVDTIYEHMKEHDIPRRSPGQPAQRPADYE